jgi:hypothetical protein
LVHQPPKDLLSALTKGTKSWCIEEVVCFEDNPADAIINSQERLREHSAKRFGTAGDVDRGAGPSGQTAVSHPGQIDLPANPFMSEDIMSLCDSLLEAIEGGCGQGTAGEHHVDVAAFKALSVPPNVSYTRGICSTEQLAPSLFDELIAPCEVLGAAAIMRPLAINEGTDAPSIGDKGTTATLQKYGTKSRDLGGNGVARAGALSSSSSASAVDGSRSVSEFLNLNELLRFDDEDDDEDDADEDGDGVVGGDSQGLSVSADVAIVMKMTQSESAAVAVAVASALGPTRADGSGGGGGPRVFMTEMDELSATEASSKREADRLTAASTGIKAEGKTPASALSSAVSTVEDGDGDEVDDLLSQSAALPPSKSKRDSSLSLTHAHQSNTLTSTGALTGSTGTTAVKPVMSWAVTAPLDEAEFEILR